jgi:hypothetical protein
LLTGPRSILALRNISASGQVHDRRDHAGRKWGRHFATWLEYSPVITERLLRFLATVTIQAGTVTQQSRESFGQTLGRIEEAEQRQVELLKQIERDLQRRSSPE